MVLKVTGKRRHTFARSHGVISHMTVVFRVTAVTDLSCHTNEGGMARVPILYKHTHTHTHTHTQNSGAQIPGAR